MRIDGKLVNAIFPGTSLNRGKKLHLIFNTEREEGCLCGYPVRWWQDPQLAMFDLEELSEEEKRLKLCRHCQRALLKLQGKWVCATCGGHADDSYSTLERPLCRECWDNSTACAEAEEEACANWFG